jgi:T5SS/PEP-CTERM-associated repeat protein
LSIGAGAANGNTFYGTMTIDGGTGLTDADGIIGNRLGANGTVVVEDPGSIWLNTDDLFVGNDGYGELFISNQGLVRNTDDFSIGFFDDGRGWTDVSGTGSFLDVGDSLTVGVSGIGDLKADDRARIISSSGVVGAEANSTGIVSITGAASWRLRSGITVGGSGFGSLLIGDGGLVENSTGLISTNAAGRGSVTVSDRGSIWLNREDLIVADQAAGELLIEADGLVQVIDDVTVRRRGRIQLSDGRLSADTIANDGVIAGSGRIEGTLTNSANGSLRTNGEDALVIASAVTNSGTIEAIDGSLDFERAVTNSETSGSIVGRNATFRFESGLTNNGKLGFSVGASDVFGNVTNSATGSVQVGGEAIVTFYDNFTSSGALSIEPESSVVFLGDASIAANARVSLAGLAVDPQPNGEPSENDPLTVAGQLGVDGTLDLFSSQDPVEITEPTVRGTSVRIGLMSASDVLGTFQQVTYDLATLNADFVSADGKQLRSLDTASDQRGMFRTISYASDSIELINYLAIAGDTNGDRDVDFGDFLTLSENFNQAGTWIDGNFDEDDSVLFGDFLLLSQNFGIGSSIAAQSVPEPTFCLLWFLAGGVMLARQRRRREFTD